MSTEQEKAPLADTLSCPVCGYYCLGKGGVGCIDKPGMVKLNEERRARDIQQARMPVDKQEHTPTAVHGDNTSYDEIIVLSQQSRWQEATARAVQALTATNYRYVQQAEEIARLRAINGLLQRQIDGSPFCPDCRDKVRHEMCPRCRYQAAESQVHTLRAERDAVIDVLDKYTRSRPDDRRTLPEVLDAILAVDAKREQAVQAIQERGE